MIYGKKSATGNAGEYYFAYWISRFFQYPCRLLDIDVGIDAQIEIFDKKNHSTGKFLGVQIKTSESDNPNTQIKLNNLEYWKSIEDIIILVSITLTSSRQPKIYWKIINDNEIDKFITEAKSNNSNIITIDFNKNNLLKKEDKYHFEILPDIFNLKKIKIKEEIIEKCKNINTILYDNKEDITFDKLMGREMYGLDTIENLISNFDAVCYGYDSFIQEYLVLKEKNNLKINKYLEENKMDEKYILYEKNKEAISEMIDYLSKTNDDMNTEYINWNIADGHITIKEMFEKHRSSSYF